MKTLGILGGMGPMATACFMERITAMTAADTDQEQIPVIVYSNTQIPDRSAYLLGRPQAENPVTALRQTAHFLDGACDYIAMPCVTAHAFYTQIQQELSHAVLFNMVELTVQSLKAQNIKKAGLLATDGTKCRNRECSAGCAVTKKPYGADLPDKSGKRAGYGGV